MSFKSLNLNVPLFDSTLNKYPNIKSVNKEVRGLSVHYTINVEDKVVLIVVFFNKNGTTTINPKNGSEQALGDKIASYLKENLTISDVKQVFFSIKNISSDNFNLLKEYLLDCEITESLQNTTNGEKYTFKSRYQDTMTVTKYSNGTILFQGKPLYVFSEIKIFLIEILDFKDVLDIENQIYKVKVSIDEIKEELEQILLKSSGYLSTSVKKMLSSSLILKKISIDMEDYSHIPYPALRAMEGYLKQSFNEKSINIGSQGFTQFTKDSSTNKYYLSEEAKKQINCSKTSNGIEKCYNYFSTHRHSLFHVNQITDSSRIISDRHEAINIVDNVFKLIEETYNERLSS